MARIFVITSGKGGVGKSTITANLGIALANQNKRVALLDFDIGLNNLDVILGIENRIVYDIVDVLEKKCRLKQALIEHPSGNLYVLPSAKHISRKNINAGDLKEIVNELKSEMDYILIDCPAGIEEGFNQSVSLASEALVIVTPHLSSLRDGDKVLSILTRYNLVSCHLVVNRIRGDMVARGEMLNCTRIEEALQAKVIGVIPESDDINLYSAFVFGESFRAFTCMARNIIDERFEKYDYLSKYKGFFGTIRRNLKRKV